MTGRRIYPVDGTCAVDGCGQLIVAKGMCISHYRQAQRAKRSGQEFIPKLLKPGLIKTCRFCARPVNARDLCSTHYNRWRHGRIVDQPVRIHSFDGDCAIAGCGKKKKGRGLCQQHYYEFVATLKNRIRQHIKEGQLVS